MSEFLLYAVAVLFLPVGAFVLSRIAERHTRKMIAADAVRRRM